MYIFSLIQDEKGAERKGNESDLLNHASFAISHLFDSFQTRNI